MRRFVSLRDVAPATPPELCEAIESLLAPDRDDRPENARAVLEMLDPFVPPPRTRRELGKMVSEVRALQATRSSEPSISGSELTGAEVAEKRPAPRVAGKWPSRRALGWGLLATVTTIVAITLWPFLVGDPQKEGITSPVEIAPTVAEDTARKAPADDAKSIAETTPEPEEPSDANHPPS